ncbi:MAG TPA: DUF1207 domain-containing protein [Candidatus Binatia bacterium]|nr:DUF1207 domain-containing protein [Candidatus Binatia bacterium]
MNDIFRQVIILLFLGGVLNAPELRSQEVTTDVLDRLLQSYQTDLQRRVTRGEISEREFETFLNEMTRAVHSEKGRLTMPVGGQSGERTDVQSVSLEETNIEENQNELKGKGETAAKGIEFLPDKLVYQPYVADPRRPRFSLKWLRGDEGESDVDSAMGGYFPVLSLRRQSALDEESQLALFAGVWSRWDIGESLDQIGSDFRGGLSFSYKKNLWALRFQYFHESDHVGDELILRTGRERIDYRRDEVGLGLSYTPSMQYRLYAEGGYGFILGKPNKPWRAQLGIEWEGNAWFPLGGQPFAALDLQTWEESKWDPNVNAQMGVVYWNQKRSRAFRCRLISIEGATLSGSFCTKG